jgi:hypothetical protein
MFLKHCCHLTYLNGQISQIWTFKNCLPEIKKFGQFFYIEENSECILSLFEKIEQNYQYFMEF